MEKFLAIFYLTRSDGLRTSRQWQEIEAISFTDARNKLLDNVRLWRCQWHSIDYIMYDMENNEVEGTGKR